MMTFSLRILAIGLMGVTLAGCNLTKMRQLEDENQRLRTEVDELNRQLSELMDNQPPPQQDLAKIRSFTVGLAASQKNFDESAFVQLLESSIRKASQTSEFRLYRENDEREVNKVRGMLLHQYLAAEEIPITISNLSYKLRNGDSDFIIGDRVVPRDGISISRAAGGAVHVTHKGAISALMRRDGKGNYSINYQERGGGEGSVRLELADVQILDPQQKPHSARQGDISFNWRLTLEQLQVYRVENFQGDAGRFLRRMRYPGDESGSLSQYQTLRDYVFLFGYGNYFTSLINQIKTPRHITEVEVLPIDASVFEKLEGGMDEAEILEIVGRSSQWQPCTFVEFENDDKVWARPPAVTFPFLSRQLWDSKGLVFYSKYDAAGQATLLGDFDRTQ